MSDTTKQVEKFIDSVGKYVTDQATGIGRVAPAILILAKRNTSETYGVHNFGIPNEFMRSGSTKDLLADVLIPGMLKTVENDSFTPVCIVFVCEMWMWELEKAAQNKPVNWKPTSEELDELKKQTKKIETIVLNFDTALNSTCVIYRKEGTDLNEDGEVTKNIHLVRWQAKEMELNEKDVKLTGRFTNLLKKYQNTNNPN